MGQKGEGGKGVGALQCGGGGSVAGRDVGAILAEKLRKRTHARTGRRPETARREKHATCVRLDPLTPCHHQSAPHHLPARVHQQPRLPHLLRVEARVAGPLLKLRHQRRVRHRARRRRGRGGADARDVPVQRGPAAGDANV